ncbi:uncharacterized protein TRIVIDRAFT_50349 [Trichoderma virens Gv29-8]|uniref:Uncharacterized protein n=1 Tax=Hypocrea virens (strain Gv29-8 / FGSC 10586) TaxID=413071 RepID=G9MXE1_HYPVG|nr:uncharacterized protein TRIVIDRAFT_50349 [Trichoderma virens Gv29-8]EHK20839.1 hypothetical protein TRIVIDRAFT_50349 [Trichoderma virens Gv29-8]
MSHIEFISNPNRDLASVQQNGKPYCISATEYSTSWSCQWTDPEFGVLNEMDLELLKHVNCSYLSSGKPPTMLALKQHAQSLTNLIRKLCVSNTFGIVNGKGERRPVFEKNEAFDWLNNLDEPYTNDDEFHHIPLCVLANHVKNEGEETGIECHCPLEAARNWGPLEPGEKAPRPYFTHQNLVMHVNECLEILDHEYSATGGLMSLLPSGNGVDGEQMSAARNTLLGQLLLHQQHMVARMHELEIHYAKALDTVSGEAVVPMQLLQRSGADERSELVHQQGRFILANAGDDVFEVVHRLMDKEETEMQSKERVWWESGVSGERLWSETLGGEWKSRGLVSVDLMTRFIRLKGQGGRSTIFIMPAIEHHPGTAETRKMENRPTVVSVVAPSWPERASHLEERVNAHIKRVKELEDETQVLERDKMVLDASLTIALSDLNKTKEDIRFYEGTSDGAAISEILSENEAMKRQMTRLRESLPRTYHHLLRDED